MSATKLQNTARITSREKSGREQIQQPEQQPPLKGQQQMIVADVLSPVVGVDNGDGANKVAKKHQFCTNVYKNNNSNNDNRNETTEGEQLLPLTSSVLAAPTGAPRQTMNAQHSCNNYENSPNDQNNGHTPLLLPQFPPLASQSALQSRSIAATATTESAYSAAVGKNTLNFCERCCESASMASDNYAQGANADRKKNSSGEDHYEFYREFNDSVSNLSSYRFISDDDEVSASISANETVATEETFNIETKHYELKGNNSNNKVEKDIILGKNQNIAPSGAYSYSNSCSYPPLSPESPSLLTQKRFPLPTLLTPAAAQTIKIAAPRCASPTICCCKIDKPISLHYNATVLEYIPNETKATFPTPTPDIAYSTAPVPIPNTSGSTNRFPAEEIGLSECFYHEELLSTSLPSNYGSVKSIERPLRSTQHNPKRFKPPPPEPPPKPKQERRPFYRTTIYSSSSASALENQGQVEKNSYNNERSSLNGQNFYTNNGQKLGKPKSLVSIPSQSSTRYISKDAGNSALQLSPPIERSVSPEHCELLSCFGTAKNTRSESANRNDERLGDARGKENSRHEKQRIKRNENIDIGNEKAAKFIARSLSESSCLVSAVTTLVNEKCAIENKNNHHHQHKSQPARQYLVDAQLQLPTSSSNHHNKNNHINNNKRQHWGDFEHSQRSAANRKKSAATSVYAVADVSGGVYDVLDTHAVASGNSIACGECNNNYNCKARCLAEHARLEAAPPHFGVVIGEVLSQSSQSSISYLSSSLPKRTLRYDSYGRLKSERVPRLPTVTKSLANGRKATSETRLHRAFQNALAPSECDLLSSLSVSSIKFTPTLGRKFNYLSDRFEDYVVACEKYELGSTCEESETTPKSKPNRSVQKIIITNDEPISSAINANTTDVLQSNSIDNLPTSHVFDEEVNVSLPKTVPAPQKIYKSFSDTQNFLSHHKANQERINNNNIEAWQSNRSISDFSLKSAFAESDSSLPCQCSSKQPISPTDTTSPSSPTLPISLQSQKSSGGLNQKNSQSLPSVPQSNDTNSPHWLSCETLASSRRSEPKSGLDDLQSNCSDQTTIFHLDNEWSLSASSLSPTSQPTLITGNSGHISRGPVVLKRIPEIHSFGHIPQIQSNTQKSANVREEGEKEVNMEKRRNTLDRFQRLGFGRKSTPTPSGASTESGGSSRNRKSTEKSERLRELTELLRGNRSSPTPPPIPPPRKPRHGSHSASNSLERSETQAHAPAVRTLSATTSSLDNTPLSFMSARSDGIMLMDQDEQAADYPSAGTSTKNSVKIDAKNDFSRSDLPSKAEVSGTEARAAAAQAVATTKSLTSTAKLSDTLKPNASLSNFESLMLMGREQSKSPPQRPAANVVASGSVNAESAQLANSSDIATKLGRPESRTVIGSYTQKGIPFRSASFSQIDISSGKYKKCSWSALRDRLWREKVVGSVDSATNTKKGRIEEASGALTSAVATEVKVNSEPDWIYIPLKKKTEMSINLNYGQDMSNLENVIESPDIIPEEDIFNTDAEHSSSATEDSKEAVLKTNLVIAHAKMESLTDTIHSENDFTIEAEEVALAIQPVSAVVESEEGLVEQAKVIEQPTIQEPINAELMEPNVAMLMEERMPLESPPDNFLQTATTCLIPVPVYECAAQEWRLENPPQEWVEVQPEEFGIIPEAIEPLLSLSDCVNVKHVSKTAQEYRVENLPTISVSRSSEEADDKCILRRKDTFDEEFCDLVERRQASIDTAELSKRYSNDDDRCLGKEKRASLEAITTRHSTDERKRIDKSKRRKGMYIDNAAWSESPDVEAHSRGLALDISLANLNVIKPDTPDECAIMYINSPPTDEKRTPGSLYSPEINTPESDKPPEWTKADRLASFSLQSSEDKEDIQGVMGSGGNLSRNNQSFPFLRTDSVSDNESDRGPSYCREHASPSPVPGDYDFKRYSKRPLRGPYGQMLEKEMKKPNKMHFEEILEDLRESEVSSQPRRPRIAYDDSSAITATSTRNIPHHSNSMRVRKSNTFLPVPAHARAASTPSQIENVSKSGAIGSLEKIHPHEKRYQSTLDNSVTSADKDYQDAGHHYPNHHLHQREVKRAASEAPAQKSHHNKRSQSMSGEKTASGGTHIVHQANRSLDATTSGSARGNSNSGKSSTIVPSQELLAELLKGSSEKLISEQRQQMAAKSGLRSYNRLRYKCTNLLHPYPIEMNKLKRKLRNETGVDVLQAKARTTSTGKASDVAQKAISSQTTTPGSRDGRHLTPGPTNNDKHVTTSLGACEGIEDEQLAQMRLVLNKMQSDVSKQKMCPWI
ncbi:uncharacterized protein LOC118755272 [Rhagoletis pomonella]|uniref:uncharacterized protein LOC118755272 n=1 Tax=Rhagoletis pomonella TaxID=28610 RepID=UPI00178201FA|nr:uncharacterized protein LOC118755272 [Rhagoletis pomonella]